MFIPVLAAFLTIAANCGASNGAQFENLVSENILEEQRGNEDDVAEAIHYMIPVPIRVVVPVPQQQPVQEPYPYPYPDREVDPIVAVPIGATPGRYGPRWRPVGPPVVAVPIGSTLPDPDSEYFDAYRRRSYPSTRANPHRILAAEAIRKTRSVDEDELKAEEHDQGELTSELSPKDAHAKGFRGIDNPLKASSKRDRKGSKFSNKRHRPKRQVGGYYVRGGYVHPTRVIVPPPGQVVVAPVPSPQYVPMPVYVPVPVDPSL